jgi:hypothetical protein
MYRYLFHARPTMPDGCAILYKACDWSLRAEDAVYFSAVSSRVSVVALFQSRWAPEKWLSCCNVHLEGAPSMHRTRATQLSLALQRLHLLETRSIRGNEQTKKKTEFADFGEFDTASRPASPDVAPGTTTMATKTTRLVCGDFNHSEIQPLDGLLCQEQGLHRAAPSALFTTRSHRMLDYAYTSQKTPLVPTKILPDPDVIAQHSRWMHDFQKTDLWPSDHYALCFTLSLN